MYLIVDATRNSTHPGGMTRAPRRPHTEVLEAVAGLLNAGRERDADALLRADYPIAPAPDRRRAYTLREMLQVFLRDGFTDRYTGDRLVHPAALRVLSLRLPKAFPYHPNGKYGLGHQAYWDLFPTIDHMVPVARGGPDTEANWMTCSMLTNARKANWLVEELGWTLRDAPSMAGWDGLTAWFVAYVEDHPDVLVESDPATRASVRYVNTWHRATVDALRVEAPAKPV